VRLWPEPGEPAIFAGLGVSKRLFAGDDQAKNCENASEDRLRGGLMGAESQRDDQYAVDLAIPCHVTPLGTLTFGGPGRVT
jgi:hypothetical protein